jgi:hypothetical protein
VLTLLAKLEAFAVAVLLTVRIDFDDVITDSHLAYLTLHTLSEATVVTRATVTHFVLSLTTACTTIAPIEAFIIIIVTTMVPN